MKRLLTKCLWFDTWGQLHKYFTRSFIASRSQMRKKRHLSHQCLFALLGPMQIKAAVKCWWNWHLSFFIRKCFAQLFSFYSLALQFFGKRILAQKTARKMLVKLTPERWSCEVLFRRRPVDRSGRPLIRPQPETELSITSSDKKNRFITKNAVVSFSNLGNGICQMAVFGKIDINDMKNW